MGYLSYSRESFHLVGSLFRQGQDFLHILLAGLADKPAQECILILHQLQRSVIFFDFSTLEDQNLIVEHDGVKPMCDSDDCGLNERWSTSLNSVRIIRWIKSSVFSSMLAVASSMSSTLGWR